MKISEVLHQAADERLWDGVAGWWESGFDVWRFSCDAIGFEKYEALCFVQELGVDPDGIQQFDEFNYGQESQGARYLWLKFAALVAESEGK